MSATLASERPVATARLGDILDVDNLRARVADGYIEVKQHPTGRLVILDYSRSTQFHNEWDAETMTCRGLMVTARDGVFDADSHIVARGFAKFFTIDQHDALAARGLLEPIPDEPFEVFTKEDGSLGVAYLAPDGRPAISTRGSFFSVQARWATDHLRSRPDLESAVATMLETGTPCFEIISPTSRIVKVYDYEGLVLLGHLDRRTGRDLPVAAGEWPGRLVARHDGLGDFRTLTALAWPNEEGFVIRFASGVRVKAKFDEYIRLHRIVTGVSTKTLWEHLAIADARAHGMAEAVAVKRLGIDHREVARLYAVDGDPLARLLEDVPDEFDEWVKQNVAALQDAYTARDTYYRRLFAAVPRGLSRKETAAFIVAGHDKRERPALFSLLDGNDYLGHIIWAEIKPTHSTAWAAGTD